MAQVEPHENFFVSLFFFLKNVESFFLLELWENEFKLIDLKFEDDEN